MLPSSRFQLCSPSAPHGVGPLLTLWIPVRGSVATCGSNRCPPSESPPPDRRLSPVLCRGRGAAALAPQIRCGTAIVRIPVDQRVDLRSRPAAPFRSARGPAHAGAARGLLMVILANYLAFILGLSSALTAFGADLRPALILAGCCEAAFMYSACAGRFPSVTQPFSNRPVDFQRAPRCRPGCCQGGNLPFGQPMRRFRGQGGDRRGAEGAGAGNRRPGQDQALISG
jgi:hypothetical protein